MDQESDENEQRFEKATSKGDPVSGKVLHKATVGVHHLREIKRPAALPDRMPPWFRDSETNFTETIRRT